jgi:Holliday junction resolvasome RuvABC endonuclease subunit
MYLALDLATETGFCVGAADTGEVPTLGHVRMPSTGPDVGQFLAAWQDWLDAKVCEVEPTLIIFEAPILPSETQMSTTRKLQGLAGVTEMVCHRAGIEVAELTTSTVKKGLTGNGRASKSDMVRACRAYGFNPHTYIKKGEESSDEADAFGIWLCALRLRHPTHAGRWDPMNFTPRTAA